MNHLGALLKTNFKLLLRNKGFLFFVLITPVVSVIIMNLHMESSLGNTEKDESVLQEISDPGQKIVYLNSYNSYSIKVFDAADCVLSEYLLSQLSENGMFCVYRLKAADMTPEQILAQAERDAMNDRIGTILYLKPDFDRHVLNGNFKDAFLFYRVSEDERWELLEQLFTDELSAIRQVSRGTGTSDAQTIVSALKSIKASMPRKEIVSLNGKNDLALTSEQQEKRSLSGYSYAIFTLGFLFCGVFIAQTVIEERENKMYTRIMLTKACRFDYLLSKFAMSVLISVLQTGELAIYMFVFRDLDYGIPKLSTLLFTFLLGLIFNLLSLELGIIIGNVMGTNYAAFMIWSVSSLLSGLYFPIEGSSKVIRALSQLMPQRWFMKGIELLMTGDTSAYPMIGCVTLAYLIVIGCVGAVGLKLKESEA